MGDLGSIPGLGRSPGEGRSYPLQYSDLENPMDCIVHGVAKSWTWLSNFHWHFMGFPGSSVGKESSCNAEDPSSIPGSGRSPGGDRLPTPVFLGSHGGSAGKESTCNAGDLDSIPGLGRSSGEGKCYSLQYSGLEKSMDGLVHGVAKSQTWLNDFHFHFPLNILQKNPNELFGQSYYFSCFYHHLSTCLLVNLFY